MKHCHSPPSYSALWKRRSCNFQQTQLLLLLFISSRYCIFRKELVSAPGFLPLAFFRWRSSFLLRSFFLWGSFHFWVPWHKLGLFGQWDSIWVIGDGLRWKVHGNKVGLSLIGGEAMTGIKRMNCFKAYDNESV